MKKWFFWNLVVVFLGFAALMLPRIRHITCQTEYGSCPRFYVDRINYLSGKSLIFLPKSQEIKITLSSYAEIAEVSLSRKFPSTLTLQIKLHQPVGIINNYLVDDGGRVLAAASDSALPRLTVAEQILPGKSLTSTQQTALTTLNTLGNIFPEILSASLSGTILNLYIDQSRVILNVESLAPHWTDSLQLIFTRGKVDGKYPKVVDMRFNHPIIVY